MIEVFHSAFGDGFTKVANVYTDSKEEAYRLTNNIDIPWRENVAVRASNDVNIAGGARSTSVGDYLKVVEVDGTFQWWCVAGYGFEKVFDDTEVENMWYNKERTERYYETLKFRALRNKYFVD